MATFQFKTPEGSIFEFDAPDQASALDAFRRNVPQGSPAPLTATPPTTPVDPAPVTAQQQRSLDLPVPDGEGGIDPGYTPERPVHAAPQPRLPREGADRDRQAIEQGLTNAPGAVLGSPADILDMGYGGFARLMDLAMPGDQSGRYADPSAWRKPLPFVGGLPTSRDINAEISQPIYEGISGNEILQDEEMTGAQRNIQAGAEFAGAAVVPSTMLANPATRAFSRTLPRPFKEFGETMTRPYAPGPRQATVVGDTIAAAGAGATSQAYEDSDFRKMIASLPAVGGPLSSIGDVIAGLAGGLGANSIQAAIPAAGRQAVAAGKWAGRLGAPEVDANFQNPDGSYVKKRDLDLAARLVQGEGDPNLAESFDSSPRGGMARDPRAAAANIQAQTDNLSPYGTKDQMATSGLASDDIGLIGEEQALRQSKGMRNAFIQRDQNVRQAAVDTVEGLSPTGATGRQFTDTMEQQHASDLGSAQRKVDIAGQNLAGAEQRNAQLAAELSAKRNGQVPASEALDKTIVDDTLVPMQGESSRMFAAADPEGKSMISSDPLLEAANKVYRTLGDLNTPNKVIPQGLLARIEGTAGEVTPAASVDTGLLDASGRPITRDTPEMQAPNEVSVRSIIDALPELATTETRARRAGNMALADNIRALRQSMDAALDEASAAGNPEAAAAIAARQNYKDTIGTTFGGGPGEPARKLRQDFNLDRFGRSTTRPSETAQRFLKPGQPEKAASLKRILDGSPSEAEGRRAAGDYMAADLAKAPGVVRADGSLDPDAIKKWAGQWGDSTIDVSPNFRSQLDDMVTRAAKGQDDQGMLANQLRLAKSDLAETQAARGAIGRVLGKNPTKAVASILESGDPERTMADLAKRIDGNESAQKGLKASVVEYLVENATTSAIEGTSRGSNPLSFAKLDDLIKKHENVLAEVFTPEEMHKLRAAHQFLAPLRNLNTAALPGSQTAPLNRLYEEARIPLKMAFRLRYGLLKGGGIASVLDNAVAMLPNGQGNADRLIARMFFDPELAGHLLTRDVSRIGSPGWNAKLIALLTAGDSLQGEDGGE